MKTNQKGKSMAKILGIIAILGAICLGISIKIQRDNQVKNLMMQIANLGKTVAKQINNSSEITNKYKGNYALFLSQTGNLPSGLSYNNGVIQASGNAKIKANIGSFGVVIFEVSNIDAKSCVKIATTNWGQRQTTLFVGVGIGTIPDFGCLEKNSCKFDYVSAYSGTSDYPFTVERAEVPCSLFERAKQPATVYLGYKLF